MGRIDEALTRASGKSAVALRGPAEQAHFVSAWTTDETMAETSTTPAQAAAIPTPARVASSMSRTVSAAVDHRDEPLLVCEPLPALSALTATWGERLTSSPTSDPVLVEQFRRLAAVLHRSQVTDGTKIVMVTSAAPADGKTLTVLNLALTLSGSYGRRVLLIDADLRRPSIGLAMRLNGTAGLSEALTSADEQQLKLISVTPTLTVLPAGHPDPNPLAGLTSARMRAILQEAAQRFDWVLLDTPPIGLLADASLMAEEVDRILLVVRAECTQFPLVQKAIEAVGRERLVGVVLNAVDQRAAHPYASSYGSGSRYS